MEEKVVQALVQCMAPDEAQRKTAEAYVLSLKTQPGFSTLLFQISQNPLYPEDLRQLSSIITKNNTKNWKKCEIPEEDKLFIKQHLIEALKKSSPSRIRAQYEEVAQNAAKREYPWLGINEQILSYLDSNDPDLIFAALSLLNRISKNYEFVMGEKRNSLKGLVSVFFTRLERVFTMMMSENSADAFPYIALILQIFWSAFYIELPQEQVLEASLDLWISKFVAILQAEIDGGLPGDSNDAETRTNEPKMQCRKWATQILYRFFSRYSDPSTLLDNNKNIAEIFSSKWKQPSLTIIISQIFKSTQHFIPGIIMNYSLKFLNEALKKIDTCEILKDMRLADGSFMISALIPQIITPLLCKTADDEDLWKDNAIEYIRKEADLSKTYYSAPSAALDLLETLCKKGYLQQFLDYLNTSLLQLPSLLHKEALIYEIGSISSVLLNNETLSFKVQDMLSTYVFPELSSTVGFLRARACWAYGKFASFPFSSPEHQQSALEKLCNLLLDSELPVKYEAALAVPKVLTWAISKPRVRNEIANLLKIYLDLINEIDSEEIIEALEDIVENFDEEVGPFAVDLIAQLVMTFSKLASREIADDGGDSAMAAVSTLNTIIRLIETVSDKEAEILRVSQNIAPLLQHCLSKQGFEYMEEALKVLNSLLYYSPPSTLGHLYGFCRIVLGSLRSEDPYGIEKTEEMYPVLANFIAKYPAMIINDVGEILAFLLGLLQGESKVQALAIRLIMALFENLKDIMVGSIGSVLQAVVNLFNSEPSIKVKVLSCQAVFVFIWTDPLGVSKTLADPGVLLTILKFFFANFKKFEERLPRTRALVGLSTLLPIATTLVGTFDEGILKEMFKNIIGLIIIAEEDEEDEGEGLAEQEEGFNEKCEELYKKIKENLEESDDEKALFDNDAEQCYDSVFENIAYLQIFKEMVARTSPDLIRNLESALEFKEKAVFHRIIN